MSGSNFHQIQQSIERAGGKQRVTLVGVTKRQPENKVREAIQAGLKVIAVNYVQEGDQLRASLGDLPVEWHFIGHIQSRKAKLLTSYDCVQSIDRISVAETLNEICQAAGRKIPILIEVNIGEEVQKSGIFPRELGAFMASLAKFSALEVKGLMGMPPPLRPVEQRRPHFRALRKVFEESTGFSILSMGTSEDYLVAIDEGSTMVRLGTLLFGDRND
jgi:PLP dependent protein